MFKHISREEQYIKQQSTVKALLESQSGIEVAASVAFVTLAEKGNIDDVTATENIGVFSPWRSGIAYEVGALREYEGKLYRCLQKHTSQDDWTPDGAGSLWKRVGDPAEEYPQWSQPIGSMDAYMFGDKVTYNDVRWISTTDNNVWAPGVYGWEAI